MTMQGFVRIEDLRSMKEPRERPCSNGGRVGVRRLVFNGKELLFRTKREFNPCEELMAQGRDREQAQNRKWFNQAKYFPTKRVAMDSMMR